MHAGGRGVVLAALLLSAGAVGADAPLPSPLEAGWKGAKVCELLYENAEVRAARCTFPPGVGHERHFHSPHWGYILQGSTMRITTAQGSVVRELKAGTNWWSDGVAWHEALNIGSTTGIYLIVEPKRPSSLPPGRSTAAGNVPSTRPPSANR